MVIKVTSAAIIGLEVHKISAEVDVTNSLPQIVIVGLGDTAVLEAKERLKLAIKNSDYDFPSTKVVINLAPANLKKEGALYDLAMAIGILAKEKIVKKIPSKIAFLGELSLDGSIRPVNGVLPIVSGLHKKGIEKVVVPYDNLNEASFAPDIEVLGARNLVEVVEFLNKDISLNVLKQNADDFLDISYETGVDFADIKGQSQAKAALEIAAAGAHNVLMSGSPGSGKTMLARAFNSILPPLSKDEAIELTKIYSVAGLIDDKTPLVTKRPFRSPHHSASSVGITGGGSNPKPGEITLAHRGVLFLDEMPEFPRSVLEVLRQPLEENFVTISRAQTSIKYPANFILIGAMNPCPCGYLGDRGRQCICSDFQIQRYKSKLSGPLLDRIDILINVQRLTDDELLNIKTNSENSKQIRERVINARKIQAERYKNEGIYTNSELTPRLTAKYCKIDDASKIMLKNAINRFNLTARSYDRILKISRTIADIKNSPDIKQEHIIEALSFRGLE
ncbi:MAG: YifB family Mg chelatase-like AAA ATPase [Candidatus Gastranaerophilales bacterium]|nr:YifB family Mg chelatase-like AAA ATPase [Candidatus Gastranaerophilales bacterium]